MYPAVKRAADAMLAGAGLIAAAPIMAGTAAAVAVKLGRPVLFTQRRPGKDGAIFTLYKFRTMLTPDPMRGLVTNEDRTTRFGTLLRSTSLDELPSLWNILRGDMSLVGPRPLREKYESRYSDQQRRRRLVRPGLTGLAQVSGRNAIAWDERLELDVRYVDTMSALLDLKILAKTVGKVLCREGVQAEGHATMSEFFGPICIDGLTLRSLSEDDLSTRVQWLSDPGIREGISIEFWPTDDEMRNWFARADADETRRDFATVDVADGELLAMCGWTASQGGDAELYIYVGPLAQGRGVGRRTMQLLETQARIAGIGALRLETKRTNDAAQKLYRRLGYQTDLDGSTDDKLAMRKELA